MLTLSGEPDVLSAGLNSYFNIKSQKTKTGFVIQFFQAFTGFVILTKCWSSQTLWLLSYDQQAVSGIS